MKSKSVIITIVCTFMLMMACTPSSLRMSKAPKEVRTDDIVSIPKVKVPVLPKDSVTLPALMDTIAKKQEVDSLIRQLEADSLITPHAVDSLRNAVANLQDEVPLDTVMPSGSEAAIKTKRDTTTMDSLELAIYKYNKVIDDSLARDSINKHRKNGIDSPVEYSG